MLSMLWAMKSWEHWAAFPEHGSTSSGILRAADAALYRARHEGRDRVVVTE
jgi:PleD family two-component response regulator